MKRTGYLLGALVLLVGVLAVTAYAGGEHPENVTLCHASGLEGTTKYETLTVGYEAAYGPAGHFDENGTPNAGHEQDYLGACHETPPPVDVCPNLEGDQSEIPPGYHAGEDENGRPICIQDEQPPGELATGVSFTEATCTTPPAFQLVKTFIPGLGLRPFYNVDGPDFVDGHPVPGGTYTFTPIPVEGYVFIGGTEFTHAFAATPTDCGGVHVVVGDAQVICLLPAGVYQLSGHVDGQVADTVTPATLPGNTKGVSNVVVTRGDTSVRTTVSTNGDCGTTTTVTVVPPTPAAVAAVAVPAAPAAPAKPVVKPKPVAKPKPKPVKRHTAVKKAKPKPKAKPHKKPHKAPQTLSLG